MPTLRKPTPEELQEFTAQGIDVSRLPEQMMFYTRDEYAQEQEVEKARQSGMLSAVGRTLAGRAGSILGGGVGALGGIGLMSALAPVTGGASLYVGLPAIFGLGAGGAYGGGKIQEAVAPESVRQADITAAAYPKTALATELVASALASGGRPGIAPLKMAAKALPERIATGTISDPMRRLAFDQALKINAANVGMGAGLQLAQTGTIDPMSLAASAATGAVFAQPNILGRKLFGWKPITEVKGKPADVSAYTHAGEGYGLHTEEIASKGFYDVPSEVPPERVSEITARRKESQERWDAEQKRFLTTEEQSRQAFEVEQKQAASEAERARLVRENPWVSGRIKERDVKTAFRKYLTNDKYQIPKDAPLNVKAGTKARINEEMDKTPTNEMRRLLFERDDPEGYAAWDAVRQAKIKARAEAEASKQALIDEQKAALAAEMERQAKAKAEGRKFETPVVEEKRPGPFVSPEFRTEAGRQGVKVGTLPPEERLVSAGGEVRSAYFDPSQQLVMLSGLSTKDSGYHELFHRLIRGLESSGNPRLQGFAEHLTRVNQGEEQLAVRGGPEYRAQVEGRRTLMRRAAQYFSNLGAEFRTHRLGSERPEVTRQAAIAFMRRTQPTDITVTGLAAPMIMPSARRFETEEQPELIPIKKAEPLEEAGEPVKYEKQPPTLVAEDFFDVQPNGEYKWNPERFTTTLTNQIKAAFIAREHYQKAVIGNTGGDLGLHWPSTGKIAIKKSYVDMDLESAKRTLMHETVHEVLTRNWKAFATHIYYEANKLSNEDLTALQKYFVKTKYPNHSGVIEDIIKGKTERRFLAYSLDEALAHIANRDAPGIVDILEKVFGKDLIATIETAHLDPAMYPRYNEADRRFYETARRERTGGEEKPFLVPTPGPLGRKGYLQINDPRVQASSVLEDADKITLINLAVPEAERGKGIGSEVLTELKRYATEKGKPIELYSRPDVPELQDKLNKFYEKNDFVPSADEEGTYTWQPSERSYETVTGETDPKSLLSPPELRQRSFFQKVLDIAPFKSEVERVGLVSPRLAKAMDDWYWRFSELRGSLTEDIVRPLTKFLRPFNMKEMYYQDNDDMQTVANRLLDLYYNDGKTDIKLTSEQQQIEDLIRANLKKSVELKNSFPDLRVTTPNPDYLPIMVSRKVLYTLLSRQGTPEYNALVDDYLQFQMQKLAERHKTWTPEKLKEEALKEFEIFSAGYTKKDINLAEQFGPIDDAAGVGIPRSWAETSLVDIMSRFNNRYARRIAYHEIFEQDPEVLKLATKKGTEGLATNENVRTVMDDINGKLEYDESKRMAVSGLVRALMLGPLTGAKDFTSNLVLGWQHQSPGQVLPSLYESIKGWKQNLAESFQQGANRTNIGTIEYGEGGVGEVVTSLRRMRDITNIVQGRNALERATRVMAYGTGKFLAMDNLWAAHTGKLTKQGRRFLDDFIPEWEKYVESGEFPDLVLRRAAARYVGSVQGTYTYQGLPAIAQRGSLAPYLALARWNIEKTNNFIKYNIEPLRQGNPTPFLMSTLGMFIGGAALTQLVELATNKKQKTPTFSEIAAAKQQGASITLPVVWKLAALSSLAGYTGMIGDITKSLMDLQFKNRAQTWDNPLLVGVSTLGRNAWDVVEAAQSGDLELTADVLSNFLEDTAQAYRLALNHLGPEKLKDIARTDKIRDLRMYRQLMGEDVTEATRERPNPYIGSEARKFKRTADINEAIELAPKLIDRAFEKSGGDIERLRSELQSLKQSSYQTMPSFENMPLHFIRYLHYLTQTQGEEAAQERLRDYLTQTTLNRAKRSLIPSIAR